jgi:addiction module RelE/StbE family toxin
VLCRVVWSPEAKEDLESISAYISRDSSFYARIVVGKILETARTLGDQPLMGRIVPEYAIDNVRERFVYRYRIIYQVESKQILVVAIVHGAQDLSSSL